MQRETVEQFFTQIQMINRHMRAGEFHREGPQITRVQWLILRFLRRHGDRTIGQLADHLNVRSSTMSQMIDRLEKAGLVCRAVSPEDARTRVVSVTTAGMKMIRAVEESFIDALTEPFDQLAPEEHGMLLALLQKLTAAFPAKGAKG